MVEQSENRILEILRRMQSDLAEVKGDVGDIKGHLVATLTQLIATQSDALRQERTITAIQIKAYHIEARLEAVCRS
jgi:hypothetical protein